MDYDVIEEDHFGQVDGHRTQFFQHDNGPYSRFEGGIEQFAEILPYGIHFIRPSLAKS